MSSFPLVRSISAVTDTERPPPKRVKKFLGAIFKVFKDASIPSDLNSIPTTFKQAMNSPDAEFWEVAIEKKLGAHKENHTNYQS